MDIRHRGTTVSGNKSYATNIFFGDLIYKKPYIHTNVNYTLQKIHMKNGYKLQQVGITIMMINIVYFLS